MERMDDISNEVILLLTKGIPPLFNVGGLGLSALVINDTKWDTYRSWEKTERRRQFWRWHQTPHASACTLGMFSEKGTPIRCRASYQYVTALTLPGNRCDCVLEILDMSVDTIALLTPHLSSSVKQQYSCRTNTGNRAWGLSRTNISWCYRYVSHDSFAPSSKQNASFNAGIRDIFSDLDVEPWLVG